MISIVLLGALVGSALGYTCPDAVAIKPCTCGSNTISCFAFNNDIDLETVFDTLSYGYKPGDQKFDTFELTSNAIEELPENVFRGVYFSTIKLDGNSKLKCVNPRAFSGTQAYSTKFLAVGSDFSSPINSDCNLFAALSEFEYLDTINITGSTITEIPAKAFVGIGGRNQYLTTINLSGGQGGSIKTIGQNAFSQLTYLKYIDLSYHQIEKIDAFAFAFTEPNTNYLTINLEHNKPLTGDSFGASAFEVGDRSTTLILRGNQNLKYLKEEVFLPFLQNKAKVENTIDLSGSFLEYDPQNEWLLEYKVQLNLQNKITNARMVDGAELWETTKKQFKASTGTTQTDAGTTQAGAATTQSASGTPKAATTQAGAASTGASTATSTSTVKSTTV